MSETTDKNDDAYTCARDYHLFGPGPKRILSLDGGGVRGAISVAFLERVEEIFSNRQRRIIAERQQALGVAGHSEQEIAEATKKLEAHRVRLGDWFDLIGGTSTGAIIAGALGLGYSMAQIKDFYLELAPDIFRPSYWRVPGLISKFDARPLRKQIEHVVQDLTLESAMIITGLCMVAKRIDTGSPWILSNNPAAPYWEPKGHQTYLANKEYKIANLVRASTAAPHFFDPEILPIEKAAQQDKLAEMKASLAANPSWLSLLTTKVRALYLALRKGGADPGTHGLFIDGGISPFNNPSLALLMLAVLKPYGLCWPLGPDQLTFVSIGTGWHRTSLSFKELGFLGPVRLALRALVSLMSDTENMALAQMQWLGECPAPWEINTEIGSLSEELPMGHHWFRFMRYDMRLDQKWLKKNLGLNVSDRDLARLRRMDDARNVHLLYGLAQIAAQMQVKEEHFFRAEKAANGAASHD